MTTPNDLAQFALQIDDLLDQLRAAATPDAAQIALVRGRLDALAEDGVISVKEWRRLVEKCAQIRRTTRARA